MKKNKLIGAKIALVVGVLIAISSSVNNNGGNGANFAMGNIMIFGSLAYMARRKQQVASSTKWRITEILSIVWVLYLTVMGIISGGWYQSPVSLLITPLWVWIAYCVALFGGKGKKGENGVIVEGEKKDNLEK